MVKIHTDKNVADLLTKAFDVTVYGQNHQWGGKVTCPSRWQEYHSLNHLLGRDPSTRDEKVLIVTKFTILSNFIDGMTPYHMGFRSLSLVRAATHGVSLEAEASKDDVDHQVAFDREFKRVIHVKTSRTELVEGKENRAGIELVQEITKESKAVKSPSIVGWKIYKEGRKRYYQITRADGKSQMYILLSQMLKSFDREDLEDLYKLVKAKYESTRPVEDLDLLLMVVWI
ncbi:hypothetical protein Tco_1485228 [Tanacetum coccineum]